MHAKGFSCAVYVIAMGIFFLAFGAMAADYSGGAGTEEDPYQIGSVEDWTTLMETDTDWDKHFLIVADIDFAGAPLTPIGNETTPFSGTFDGANHSILNGVQHLFSNYGGVWGYMDSSGVIRNVGVRNMAVLSGHNCHYIGGLLGSNRGGKITSCYATGKVTGNDYVGGLLGINGSGGTVASCYATGAVTGDDRVGGLMALNEGTVTNCYATGAVTGSGFSAGLVVINRGIITSCYATGSDLVGGNAGTVTSSYWNIDTSGREYSSGGVGCVTDDMVYPYDSSAYLGWDFTKIWAADTDYSLNNGYPYLRGNEPTQATLAVEPIRRDLEASTGTTTFEIKTTSRWDVTSSVEWAEVNPVSGTGNGNFTLSYEANSVEQRQGTISVTGVDTNPGLVKVQLYQAADVDENTNEGEGEEVADAASCGCNSKAFVTSKHLLGDWLLIGVTLMAVAGMCFRRRV